MVNEFKVSNQDTRKTPNDVALNTFLADFE